MSTEESRQALRAGIAKRRAELRALDRQRAMAREELGSLETELAFYGYVFGFTPAGGVSEVDLGSGIPNGTIDG